MKVKTVISKFKKIGIEFNKQEDSNRYTASSDSQIISFVDQDGDAIVLSTCDKSTNTQDRLDYLYSDVSYKTFHESAKGAVEWVIWADDRAKKGA